MDRLTISQLKKCQVSTLAFPIKTEMSDCSSGELLLPVRPDITELHGQSSPFPKKLIALASTRPAPLCQARTALLGEKAAYSHKTTNFLHFQSSAFYLKKNPRINCAKGQCVPGQGAPALKCRKLQVVYGGGGKERKKERKVSGGLLHLTGSP